jgi:hypothetical protein
MRYSLSDLENRFAGRPNARWSSIRAELKRLETAEALREEAELMRIHNQIWTEDYEAQIAAMKISDAVVADMPKPSYFDRLLAWFK